MFQTRCRLLLAQGIIDIVEAFAPDVFTHSRPREPCANVIVGCKNDREQEGPHPVWIPAGMKDLGHWVAGLAMNSAMPSSGRTVRDHCLRYGFAPVMTVANGDCGPDALLIMSGATRSCVERQRLRIRLSAFMKEKATDVQWQAVFKNSSRT